MAGKNEVLERAFRAIDELLGEPDGAPPRTEQTKGSTPSPVFSGAVSSGLDNHRAKAEVETACRCSIYPFPHVHGREDRRRAIEQWNRDSRHKVEWIQ